MFQSYAKLIDLLNGEHKRKRWQLKREVTDKLDRYITIQEAQTQGYKQQIEDYRQNFDRLKQELEEYLYRMN